MDRLEREARWLLDEKYDSEESPAYRRDLERLARGEHIDHVMGFARFLGVKVDLSARPLIPRPETEYWTEKIIADMLAHPIPPALSPKPYLSVLDLFCGSGCIGLAVLHHLPGSKVDFADIETKYFPGIRKSLKQNKISLKRAGFHRSDVLKDIADKYDYILANPPYIRSQGRKVESSVLEQEPHNALFGGKDGLRFIRTLLRTAKGHLKDHGALVLEFDPPQKKDIAALARRYQYEVRFFRDQYARVRYAILKFKLQGL